jgi:hypothetical protein
MSHLPYFTACLICTIDPFHRGVQDYSVGAWTGAKLRCHAVLEVARRFGKGAYIIRTISDGAGDDSHLSYAEMVAIVAHNSALCVEDLLRIMP